MKWCLHLEELVPHFDPCSGCRTLLRYSGDEDSLETELKQKHESIHPFDLFNILIPVEGVSPRHLPCKAWILSLQQC